MRKGLMQDYANQIAQMFVGWQIEIIDLPRLLEIGRGQIEVDLLTGITSIDRTLCESFSITEAVQNWLTDALDRDDLPASYVRGVLITSDFDANQKKTSRGAERSIRLECTVVLDAENGTWTGSNGKAERWEKVGAAPWVVTDL